jgi:hypothetical protein
MARRFVADMVAQTDATFNTNELRLLLQCFIGIDNTGKTFQFLQAFSTTESADIIQFLLQVLQDNFFYDCPGFAVLMGDFGSGLTKGFAQKAQEDRKLADEKNRREATLKGKQKQREISTDNVRFEQYEPLPTAPARPEYELDSQTIIVANDPDWVRAVPPTVVGLHDTDVILQYCTWHAAEAIKRKLIASGYQKERRKELVDLIWKWIKAEDLEKLEIARKKLIFALNNNEKEYLVGYYQPKEPQFCHAYTSQYRNLGATSTQRIEKNHDIVSANLHKDLKLSDAVFRLCETIDTLGVEYEKRLESSRISDLRLFDRQFFSLVRRRITLYAIEKCSTELLYTKVLFDEIQDGKREEEFDPNIGCQDLCELPLRYRLPCRHWMLYFYRKNEPIPINLFHPRWLIDGPTVLVYHWQIRLENFDYSTGALPPDVRHTGDRSGGSGEQLIVDTALAMVERHRNLPPGEKEYFSLAFKKMCDSLVTQHDEKLERLQLLPRRLPDSIIQPRVTFVPGRKRALTGREVADLKELETLRSLRRAQIFGAKQAENDARQEQHTMEILQHQDLVAEQYNVENSPEKSDSDDPFASVPPSPKPSNSRSLIPNCIPSSQPREVIDISSDDESILAIETTIPSGNGEYTVGTKVTWSRAPDWSSL